MYICRLLLFTSIRILKGESVRALLNLLELAGESGCRGGSQLAFAFRHFLHHTHGRVGPLPYYYIFVRNTQI